jgi:peroxiredoxin Q/BCP
MRVRDARELAHADFVPPNRLGKVIELADHRGWKVEVQLPTRDDANTEALTRTLRNEDERSGGTDDLAILEVHDVFAREHVERLRAVALAFTVTSKSPRSMTLPSPGASAYGSESVRRTTLPPLLCRVNATTLGTIAAVVEEGMPAPDFSLTSDSGEIVSLSDLRGRPVVLYFYPKDDTPGCTAQACGIRDVWGEFERKGAVVLGVSPDSPKQHVKFREKYSLPFTLLSDESHDVAEQYGTWVEKTMSGKTYMGMQRSTFVIDADGKVARIMRNVKPAEHADDVLAAL